MQTSGCPLGSKSSSGNKRWAFSLGVDLGGEGLLEYSVKERELMRLGVLGLEPKPLISVPFSIFGIASIASLNPCFSRP